MLKTKSVVV